MSFNINLKHGMKQAAALLALLFSAVTVHAKGLCTTKEEVIISFQVKKSAKMASVCKGDAASYLVYRFGTPQKIELQYPQKLDASSWDKFRFEGYHRGGGKQNAGMDLYSLSFNIGEYEYEIAQTWHAEEDAYRLGIDVRHAGKNVSIDANVKSQIGSLNSLLFEEDHIRNSFGE
jgi:hypothetical protein